MSDAEYFVFRQLGGVDWLRSRISRHNMTGSYKAVRNRSIGIDRAAGMTLEAIGRKYQLDKSTVGRIVSI
jgi:hypothetical protein